MKFRLETVLTHLGLLIMFKTVAGGSDIFHVCEQHPACTENTGCKNRALFSGYQHTED